MEFKKVVQKRYSTRQYRSGEVSDKTIKEIIEIAKLAPSAGNLQSYKVFITRQKLTYIDAPVNLVICADLEKSASRYGERGRALYAIQDATIFAAYLQLAAVDLGLASCWVGAFRENKIRQLINIPEKLKPIVIITLGYPLGEKTTRKRRSFEEIIYRK